MAAELERELNLTDKTLVAWVRLANLDQRGGSAMTIDNLTGGFDGLVYGELAPRRWMPGSDFFQRTPAESDQQTWPEETAISDELIQMAAVYRGCEIFLYRNGELYAYHTSQAPLAFSSAFAVIFGLRHLGAYGGQVYLTGEIEEARLYAEPLTKSQLRALALGTASEGRLLGWWTFEGDEVTDLMGNFPPGKLVGEARVKNGALKLAGTGSYCVVSAGSLIEPMHFRPAMGVFADPIPLYAKGEYHVFYLLGGAGHVTWEHLVSTDLVHWKELPTALAPTLSEPESADGFFMFTGSALEAEGQFHIFYTGHNPRNPKGLEFVLHATSDDLITWTKDRAFELEPDGVIYNNAPQHNFRDPYVFFEEKEGLYWLVVIGDEIATGRQVQGLFVSEDLKHWTARPPLIDAPGQECPDLFQIGDLWYLIGGDQYTWARQPEGPYYAAPVSGQLDRPGVYAAKRLFDGNRHIWWGWLWDRAGHKDEGQGQWGGVMCLPREVYAGPAGQLYMKPVDEYVAVFNKVEKSLPASILLPAELAAPADYLLEAEVKLEAGAKVEFRLRQPTEGEGGYTLSLDQDAGRLALSGPGFLFERPCPVEAGQPVKVQAFLLGSCLECFVDDKWALSCRAYDFREGSLKIEAKGDFELKELELRTPDGTS